MNEPCERCQMSKTEVASLGRQVAHLQEALVSARRIGTATGILMATLTLGMDEAFERLSTVSQTRNIKVRDLAEIVILTGSTESFPGA